MDKNLIKKPPIVIFGTGGSGTRVVAEILKESGCYIGDNLNRALDNLTFGYFLAGRTKWMKRYFPFESQAGLKGAAQYLGMFKTVYFGCRLKPAGLKDVLKISFEFVSKDREMFNRRPFNERLFSGANLFKKIFLPGKYNFYKYKEWGFKSPEAIYFIIPLINEFSGIRFIHLLRDGRDMAVSTNINPLRYRNLFDIKYKGLIDTALDNWLTVNKWAKDICKRLLPSSQYLLIKYEDICKNPVESVDRILKFSGLSPQDIERIYRIPKSNPKIGRWKKYREKFESIDKKIFSEFGYNGE